MDNDRVKGAIDEIAGVAKQKTGELTGNGRLQVKGITQHLKGKIESALGKAKNTIHEASKQCDVDRHAADSTAADRKTF